MDFDGSPITNVAVRYKGNGTYQQSRATLKRPFKVDLNEFVKGRKVEGAGKINFHNNVADPSGMNEAVAYALYREAGIPAPRTSYSRLFVSVTGRFTNQYLGLYTVVENPDQNWAESRFGSKKGMILKPSTRDLFRYRGEEWSRYRATYDPKTPVMENHARRVIDLARLVTQAGDAEFAKRLPEFLDLDEFARFLAVTVYLAPLDSILGMGENFIVYLDPGTARFSFVPWDLDQAFGGFAQIGTQEQRERLSIERPWIGENRFVERVMGVEAFRELYRTRLAAYQTNLFRPERIATQVEALARLIRPAVADEGAVKLGRFDRAVAGESVAPLGPNGEIPTAAPVSSNGLPKPARTFAAARHASIAEQLAGRSAGLVIETVGAAKSLPDPAEPLARTIVACADSNGDGAISGGEFSGLSEKWFAEWGGGANGVLRITNVVVGLRSAVSSRAGRGASASVTAEGGAGEFLAQAILAEFDRDHSGALSRNEFSGGFISWFSAWDSSRAGKLSVGDVGAGIRRVLAPAAHTAARPRN